MSLGDRNFPLHYNLMGPPSCMWSVTDWSIVMCCMTVLILLPCPSLCVPTALCLYCLSESLHTSSCIFGQTSISSSRASQKQKLPHSVSIYFLLESVWCSLHPLSHLILTTNTNIPIVSRRKLSLKGPNKLPFSMHMQSAAPLCLQVPVLSLLAFLFWEQGCLRHPVSALQYHLTQEWHEWTFIKWLFGKHKESGFMEMSICAPPWDGLISGTASDTTAVAEVTFSETACKLTSFRRQAFGPWREIMVYIPNRFSYRSWGRMFGAASFVEAGNWRSIVTGKAERQNSVDIHPGDSSGKNGPHRGTS